MTFLAASPFFLRAGMQECCQVVLVVGLLLLVIIFFPLWRGLFVMHPPSEVCYYRANENEQTGGLTEIQKIRQGKCPVGPLGRRKRVVVDGRERERMKSE